MVSVKELDERLRLLGRKVEEEEADWREEQRKLFEFEEKFLRDTVVEGNMVFGWGEPRSASIRFRNSAIRKKKRERQDYAAAVATVAKGKKGKDSVPAPATPTLALTAEEQLKVDRHRYASYSSITSPAESLRLGLDARTQQLEQVAPPPKPKKLKKAPQAQASSSSKK